MATALVAVLCGCVVSAQSGAGAAVAAGESRSAAGRMLRLVKQFDFDERGRGNFEGAPMHWRRMTGPGLPAYATGAFDEVIGAGGPPSFRLAVRGGNIGYEYDASDITVAQASDYVVAGRVRAEGLVNARALLAIHLVDARGQKLAGSERVSNLVRSQGVAGGEEPWQQVEVTLTGDFPTAAAMRVQVWLLQSYVWDDAAERGSNTIVRQDVHATAWFDDIAVYRLPRTRLRLSNPGGIVSPGVETAFLIEVNKADSEGGEAELIVEDGEGREVQRAEITMTSADGGAPPAPEGRAGGADRSVVRIPVATLPPGIFRARLRLLNRGEPVMERSLRFAMLAPLPVQRRLAPDLGVDVGPWSGGDVGGLRELLSNLGCGAAKVGLPLLQAASQDRREKQALDVSALARELGREGLDVTAIILESAGDVHAITSTRDLVERDGQWREWLRPLLAQLGGTISSWQLGDERIELRDGAAWSAADVATVRQTLERFMTLPQIVVPQSALRPGQSPGDVVSIWVPARLPSDSLPWQLRSVAEPTAAERWLRVDTEDECLSPDADLAEFARRVVLAKALGAVRTYVEAPFEVSDSGGSFHYQPQERYLIHRTLCHFLSGRDAVGVVRLAHDSIGIIFGGSDTDCMVLWTWSATPPDGPIEAYLGGAAKAIDLFGRPIALESVESRTRLRPGPLPILIWDLNTPLAMLQGSLTIAPAHVEVPQAGSPPTLELRNRVGERMTGQIRLSPPRGWEIVPDVVPFALAPGESVERPLELKLPPRQVAGSRVLGVTIRLDDAESSVLRLEVPLTVGLRDILVDAAAHWSGDDLVVVHSLRNVSDATVSFSTFCQAANRPRVEGAFLEVPSGGVAHQTYVFPSARIMVGQTLHLGIEEIGGRRVLDHLVEAPG
jgi:hypothetical protein